MKKITFLFTFFLCIFMQQAQTPQWVHDGAIDVSGDSGAITTDAVGNVYVAQRSTGAGILFVSKFNPAGNLIWSDALGANDGLVPSVTLLTSIKDTRIGGIYGDWQEVHSRGQYENR